MAQVAVRGRSSGNGPLLQILEGLHEVSAAPLYVRLYRHVRDAILDGSLPPGQRLPASRTLAADLNVSRNTVEMALSQLRAEGFIQRRVGAGSTVAAGLPLNPRSPSRYGSSRWRPRPQEEQGAEVLSGRGRGTLDANHLVSAAAGFTFASCLPDDELLPSRAWRRIVTKRSRTLAGTEQLRVDPAGYRPLREAIAAYLVASRGVRCTWRQVLVTGSVQQGVALVARMLLDEGDAVWLEEPGYPGARTAFGAAGARIVPVTVDDEGLDVGAGMAVAAGARLAYVTPSHQYPLGVTLSLARRMALLEWAAHNDAWILEDDYDSEFRYVGRPLASIQGLDTQNRVIYAGTFNKVLCPSIRLAYLVLPSGLTDAFAAAQDIMGNVPSTFVQSVVAEFMESGHFTSHLRRAREVYRERRAVLLAAIAERLAGELDVGRADAGLHIAARFRHDLDDRVVTEIGARHGLDVPPLSLYYAGEPHGPGLLIHYARTPAARIRAGVDELAAVLRAARG